MKSTKTGYFCLLFGLCSIVIFSSIIFPQSKAKGPLGDLYLAREGGLIQYSSIDSTGGNFDKRKIAPGETLVILDHKGTGVIKRWWITIAPRNNKFIQRQLIIRCYWDNEKTPSVEVPVSDFFGMGFGEWKDYISLPMSMTSGGYNSYWPMPFKRSALITVENMSKVPIESFYYNIDIRTYESLPENMLYFHAQFRKTRTEEGESVKILEASGKGHYVGTLLSMQPIRGKSFSYLEGDEQIFIDGESKPGIIGTGTEDYFSSGWYYDTGEYSAPYHGVTIKDTETYRINSYRWHIEDPIPFEKSILFQIEHGAKNDPQVVEYSSVAFWYQTHPHAPFPELPAHLLPFQQITFPSIEAEAFLEEAYAGAGEITTQNMAGFSGTWGDSLQLWWVNAKPGSRLVLPLNADSAGAYELIGFFTRAQNYGIIRLHINNQTLEPLMDGFNLHVEPTGPISFGRVELQKGKNILEVELIGKDARSAGYSDGYLVGIDGFFLKNDKP